jgi:hypothetical protein
MNEQFAIMAVLVSLIIGVATILRAGLDHLKRSKTERLQFELYNKVLDKSGSNQDLLAWLQNEGAQGLLKVAEAPRPMAYNRILNAIQAGLLAVVLGAGFIAVSAQMPIPDYQARRLAAAGDPQKDWLIINDIQRDREHVAGVNGFGIVLMMAGFGLLAGGGATWYLSRKFHLINGDARAEPTQG